jgi:SAM-dependent methyltransferase
MTTSADLPSHLRWGAISNPIEASSQLQIPEHLPDVPENGTVVDLGAGIGNTLASAIFIARPDLTVISVDAGYIVDEEEDYDIEAREFILGCYTPDKRALLEADNTWLSRRLAGYAERVPLEDATADLVVSYAAVPGYSPDLEVAFDEIVRILKVGGVALNGPMGPYTLEKWGELAEARIRSGAASSLKPLEQIVKFSGSSLGFSVIRK